MSEAKQLPSQTSRRAERGKFAGDAAHATEVVHAPSVLNSDDSEAPLVGIRGKKKKEKCAR